MSACAATGWLAEGTSTNNVTVVIEVVEDRGQTGEGARVVVGALDQQRDGLVLHRIPFGAKGSEDRHDTGGNLLAVSFGSFADLGGEA